MSIFSNTLYFMAENTAITYTQSSNVSILVSTAPVLTAILLALTPSSEKPNRNTVLGILVALVGMVMVVFNGAVVLKLNPVGDLLSMGAALSWAVYSLILQRYSSRFSSYLISRKLMFYGILTTLPLLAIEGAPFPISSLFTQPTLLLGLLFLGVLGSALCYVCWNSAADTLGVLQTTMYIYAVPFVTMVSAALYLNETITAMGIGGAVLIVLGMVLSSKPAKAKAE